MGLSKASFAVAAISIFVLQSASAAVNKKPVVFTKNVALTDFAEKLTYPARIEPRIRAVVTADTDGVVSRIIAPLGTTVRKNAPLIVIKNTDPVYQYSPMAMTSTVNGIVSRLEVTEGSRVTRGDKLILVTDPEQVRVAVEVTAQDLPKIRPGQSAQLTVPGSESVEPVTLKVIGISPFVDPGTGTASCELELVKKKGASLPPLGVIARVHFTVDARKAIAISDSALTYRGNETFVRIVLDGKAKLVPVTVGRTESGTVEITKGLKSGDVVVERASGFVSEGEEVDAQDPTAKKNEAKTEPTKSGKG